MVKALQAAYKRRHRQLAFESLALLIVCRVLLLTKARLMMPAWCTTEVIVTTPQILPTGLTFYTAQSWM
jgi:hypothetical protein